MFLLLPFGRFWNYLEEDAGGEEVDGPYASEELDQLDEARGEKRPP